MELSGGSTPNVNGGPWRLAAVQRLEAVAGGFDAADGCLPLLLRHLWKLVQRILEVLHLPGPQNSLLYIACASSPP